MSEPGRIATVDSVWDSLVNAALLGTDRAGTVVPALPTELNVEAAGTAPEAEEALLHIAAVLVTRDSATPIADATTPPDDPAPPETRPDVPPVAAARLAEILADQDTELLRQWLAVAAEAGLLVPPRLQPDLLEATGLDWRLSELIALVVGRRGRWLGRHWLSWQQTLTQGVDDVERYSDGWLLGESTTERLTWLRVTRARDAPLARAALGPTLSSEPVNVRRAVVELIRDEPEPPLGDAALLLAAVTDPARSVRVAAAEALSRLPDSPFAREVTAAGLCCVTRAGDGTRLEVRLSPEVDLDRWATVLPDGLGPADMLKSLLALVPLRAWEEQFGRTAEELMTVGVGDDSSQVLLSVWQRAALVQRSPQWAAAALATVRDSTNELDLLRVVPAAQRAPFLGSRIGDMLPDGHGRSLLDLGPTPWPPELWQAVLKRVLAPEVSYQTVAFFLEAARACVGTEAIDELRSRVTELPDEHPVRTLLDWVSRSVTARAAIRSEILTGVRR